MKGYIQVYTGNGKGKSTAAFGLALRAAGAGMSVLIIQFLKSRKCSEHTAFERFSDVITIRQFGNGRFVFNKPTGEQLSITKRAFEETKREISSGKYDLVILDEINMASAFRLIPVEYVIDLIKHKPETVELVLTGRGADPRIIEIADLVTVMNERKHYYKKGIKARIGIEL